jgi:hypothetical protein
MNNMKLLNKRAQVGNLAGFFMGIGVAAIVLTVIMIVLQELQYSATSDGTSTGTSTKASNATGAIITKLATAPTWIGLIILAGLAFIVLGFFMGRRGY